MLFGAAATIALASWLTDYFFKVRPFVVAYVIYGLIAVFIVIVPSLIARTRGGDVPYPPFFRALYCLEILFHPLALLVVIGLAILTLHLALYPWPSVFHMLKGPSVSELNGPTVGAM
jgi:hypothetical protein